MLRKERPCKVLVKLNVLVKMKLIVIILVAAGLQVNANGYAQNTVSLSERNSSLIKVFKEIKKQTGYSYILTSELLAQAGKVNIEVSNVTLKEALDMIFREQPLAYSIIGKTIVVKEREEPKKEAIAEGLPIDVRGRVVNEKGEPVEGVTVTVKGTKKFTITNANGEFSFKSIESNAILMFTSVNMETVEAPVGGQESLVINLTTKIKSLGDVTVTAVNTGFQTLKPNEVTGSVVVITKDQLDQRVAPDIISKLEGITNGLVFNKEPDGKNALRIRGESTIFANPNPLIIVDNFPFNGDINNLNPNDIQSITVLKDAAATSIWGVQAGNGVIVIVTKKGRYNQPLRLEVNSNITVGDKPDVYYAPQINPSDYIDFETFLFNKGAYNSLLANVNKVAVSPVVEILNSRKLNQISSADSAARIDALRSKDLREQMLKYIYRNPVHQQYAINMNGGGSQMAYSFSVGYDKDLSNVIGNTNDRITLNSQNIFSVAKNFDLRAGVLYTEGSSTNNGRSTIPNIYPYMQLVDPNGVELPIPQHRSAFEDTITNRGFLNWKYYPLQERESANNNNKSRVFHTRITTEASYKLMAGLSIDFNYQYERSVTKDKNLISRQSYFIRDRLNTFAILSNGNYSGSNFPNGGILSLSTSDLVGHYGRLKINYNRDWNADHKLISMLGIEASEVRTEGNSSRLYGYNDATGSFVIPNLFSQYPTYPSGSNSILASPNTGVAYSGTINRFRSYFGNATYIYKSRYSASLSGRLDGSNYFGVRTNQKTVPLWSAGVKWDISSENFYSLKHRLPLLALRFTYGYAGNLASNIAAITTFQYLSNSSLTGLPYAGINNIPNPELRWEKTGQFNIGLDFSTVGDRISGSIEFYKKKGNDLIGDAPIDPTTGVTQLRGNFSAMESKGIDIQLTSRNIEKVIQWTTTLFFNYTNEKVTRFDVPVSAGTSYLTAYYGYPIVGKPLHGLFSYRWAGLDPADGGPRVYFSDTVTKNYSTSLPNQFKQSDFAYSGRYNPSVAGGLINSVSWKGLNLTFNINYKFGYYFRRRSISYSAMFTNGWQAGHQDFAMRWLKPGDEKTTNIPSMVYPFNATREGYYANADILVEKADHIRLQFINLNYKFKIPNALSPIKSAQVYLYVNNVGILWRANDKGIDPDYPYASFPPVRTYSAGIRLGI